ncbi:MAG: polysaccharide biosynthesis tyrosine autokinase [Verrucomicrobiota bacterium]|jgi:capsular exopolysaccharide synthesis family protein
MDPLKVTPPQETKLHFLDYWRIIRIRKTVILAVFLLVVITATLVTFILPESYSSTAKIKIERDRSDIPEVLQAQLPMGNYDPYFIQTEFEVIQSELILGKVIESQHLQEEWGKKFANGEKLTKLEAINSLKSRMALHPVRNTIIIEIQVFSDKPKEAADIANAIAEAYQQHRLDERKNLSTGGIAALLEARNLKEAEIVQAQTNVDRLRRELNISDSMASEYAAAPLLSAETLRHINGLRLESEANFVQQETLLNHLKTLKPEVLKHTLPTALQDNLLGTLLDQKTYADQRLLSVEKDYGALHPDVIKARALVADLQDKIDQRVAGIMVGLGARVDAMGQSLTNLNRKVEEAISNDIVKANQSAPYFDAKRRLEELLRFRTLLDTKIASEKVDVSLPKTVMVTITDRAQPGAKPVRPNKPLNIALGIIIGLVVGVGLAFFIEYLDTSVKTIDDVERSLQAPVLGVIPQNVGLMLDEGAESPHAEAYRVLRTNIMFSRKDDKLNSIAVVSAGAGEGKSTTVFNLASIFAQSGQRVIVVDSDLRRPTLHKMLHVTNNIGLTNYLLKQNGLEEVIQTTSNPALDFLASGKLPSSSLGILSSAQMKDMISELKQRYDFVFFDSPPIMGVSDASILASEVDMTLQVIQYRRYPQPMNIRAKQLIEKVGGNLVGIVLNNINMSQDESYYYYSGYYHDYYYRSSSSDEADAAANENKDKTGSADKAKLDIKPKY